MELVVNKEKIEELLHWCQSKLDEETCNNIFYKSSSDLTDKDIFYYLRGLLEYNIENDLNFEFGLD